MIKLYTDEELLKDIQRLIETLGTCNYIDRTQTVMSHRKVSKAYNELFNIKHKIQMR